LTLSNLTPYLMNAALLTVILFLSINGSAQVTVTRDTTTNIQEDIEIVFSVSSYYDSTDQITIEHFSLIGNDTISVFVGTYNIDDDDPSEFVTFWLDETLGEFVFGIGTFIPSPIYSKVTVEKLVGLPEEFIIN